MNGVQTFFMRVVHRIETEASSLQRYVLLFFAILVLRLTLEFFSNNRLFTLADVIHISLWFMFIVLAFLIQLHLFSGEEIRRVFKLVITCFSIALTAPLIDIFVSRGVGVKMNYLALNGWQEVVFSYFTIGGASLSRGATWGIRIEIVILVVASFNYVYIKTKQLVRALLAAFSIYTVLFFSGALPFLLGGLVNVLNLHYAVDDNSTTLALLTFNLGFILILCVCLFPKRALQFCQLVEWWRWLILLIIFWSGALLARQLYPSNWQLNPSSLWHFPLLLLLGLGGCVYFYKIKDRATCAPTASNASYTLENAWLIWIMVCSLAISYRTFFVALLIWGLLFLNYETPLRLYRLKFLNTCLSALVLMAFALCGFVSFNAPLIGFPAPLLLGGLLIALVCIGLIDYKPRALWLRWVLVFGVMLLLFTFSFLIHLTWVYQLGLLVSILPFARAYLFTKRTQLNWYILILPMVLFIFYCICIFL